VNGGELPAISARAAYDEASFDVAES